MPDDRKRTFSLSARQHLVYDMLIRKGIAYCDGNEIVVDLDHRGAVLLDCSLLEVLRGEALVIMSCSGRFAYAVVRQHAIERVAVTVIILSIMLDFVRITPGYRVGKGSGRLSARYCRRRVLTCRDGEESRHHICRYPHGIRHTVVIGRRNIKRSELSVYQI